MNQTTKQLKALLAENPKGIMAYWAGNNGFDKPVRITKARTSKNKTSVYLLAVGVWVNSNLFKTFSAEVSK